MMAAPSSQAFSSRLSSSKEAQIRTVGDDLLWARFDKADFVQAQCPEPHCVFGVVFAPFVGIILQGLQQRIVSVSEPAIGDCPCDTLGFAVAEIRRFQDGSYCAFGCNRIVADKFTVTGQHAA